MRAFVTGVSGYIGVVLAPYLMERGIDVVGLDTGYYRDGWLFSDNRRMGLQPYTLNKDLREIIERDYKELTLVLFPGGAWKSTVIMAGSILEAILYDVLASDLAVNAKALASSNKRRRKAGSSIR